MFSTRHFCFTFFISVIILVFGKVIGQSDWCYEGSCGPKTWTGSCQTGTAQSPINIIPASTTRSKPNRTLVFSAEFYDMRELAIFNTGKTITLVPTDDDGKTFSDLRVKGAGWNGTFHLEGAQFHWGSEHMIKGQRLPLEFQMVFHQANTNGRRLGIISVLFGLSKKDSKALAPIVSLLSGLRQVSEVGQLMPNGFNFSTVFPNVWDVFRYNGSFTQPPCNPSVMWSVFTQKMPVSQTQIDAFAKIQDNKRKAIKLNYRPLQKVFTKDRKKVYWMKIDKAKMRENAF